MGWGPLLRTDLADYGIFSVVRKSGVSPRTSEPVHFHALEMADWVQVLPLTRDGRFVMVEQFRPGAEVRALEFPAGMLDRGESAQAAATRELEEETGYRGGKLIELGVVHSNPAIQSNVLHVWLAQDCEKTGTPSQDEGEDVYVRLVEAADIPEMIRDRAIQHALVLTAWQLYEVWRFRLPASLT